MEEPTKTAPGTPATPPAFIELEGHTAKGVTAYRHLVKALEECHEWIKAESNAKQIEDWDIRKWEALNEFSRNLAKVMGQTFLANSGNRI